jgi:DNA polymerase III subunit chi
MTEVWFYHLERQSPETVLPRIVAGLYERGETVWLVASRRDFLTDISKQLWAFDDTAFLPHGLAWEAASVGEAVILTDNCNTVLACSQALFVNTMPTQIEGAQRISIFFDGNSENELASARDAWKSYRAAGLVVKYWRQGENGRWEDQATRGREAA